MDKTKNRQASCYERDFYRIYYDESIQNADKGHFGNGMPVGIINGR